MAAGDQCFKMLTRGGVIPADQTGFDIQNFDRNLQHNACARMNRQKGRIAGGALLAEGRQHNRHNRVITFQHPQQRRIKAAGCISVGGGHECIVKAELVEKGAQHRIVVMGKALEFIEGVGHLCQRLAQMQAEHVLIGHIVRHFAQAVHIIGKGDELGRNLVVGEQPESLTHHGCARHFAECADMRQARGAIAGFKQNFSFMRLLGAAGQQFAGLFKGPGIGHLCGFNQCSGKMISHCGIRFQMGQKELLLYRQLAPGAQENCAGLSGLRHDAVLAASAFVSYLS